MRKPKKVLNSKVVYQNPLYKVRLDNYVKHNEKKGKYYSMITNPFVLICALSSDRRSVYLVKVWRYPVKKYLWELPKGWMEKNETPLMAAKRELTEETGMIAKKWKKLGWLFLAPGITNQKGHIFVAERLQKAKSKIDDEIFQTKPIKITVLKKMVAQKKFFDCASLVASQQLFNYLKNSK